MICVFYSSTVQAPTVGIATGRTERRAVFDKPGEKHICGNDKYMRKDSEFEIVDQFLEATPPKNQVWEHRVAPVFVV